MADLQSRTGYVLLVLSLTVLGVTLAFNHQFGADTVKLGSGAITFELNYARLPGNYFAFSHTHSYSLMRTHLQAHAHTTLININTHNHQFGTDAVKFGSDAITFELNYARLPGTLTTIPTRSHAQPFTQTAHIHAPTRCSCWHSLCIGDKHFLMRATKEILSLYPYY